jgi:hypothetical protein
MCKDVIERACPSQDGDYRLTRPEPADVSELDQARVSCREEREWMYRKGKRMEGDKGKERERHMVYVDTPSIPEPSIRRVVPTRCKRSRRDHV